MGLIANTTFRKPQLSVLVSGAFASIIIVALCIPFVQSAFAAQPTITGITSVAAANSATISWQTDVVSDSQIEYGLTSAYGSQTPVNSGLVTSHSQTITGLQANQLYHYRVKSRDLSGDLAVSGDRTLITALGQTTPGSSVDSSNSHTMNASRFTTTNGGDVASLSVHVGAVDANAANRSFQLALYRAAGSVPGELVASTQTGTLAANTWNTLPIEATLAPSTSYFIAYNTNGASPTVNNMHYTSGGTSGWSSNGQAFGIWPSSFGPMSPQSITFSLYASFEGDTTPPTVNVTAPTQGATVSGTATITADVTDDTAIQSVQFKYGTKNIGSPDTTAPFSADWDTTSLLNGPYDITAVATDTSGNAATSNAVTVNTANAPKVAIAQPTANQNIAATSISVKYTKAGDWLPGDGKHVHFRLDGGAVSMDLDQDNDQTYTFVDVPGGSHTITAIVATGSHEEIAGSNDSVSFTTTAPDTTPPTVSVTAPTEGATVANTVSVTANAADNDQVAGVQFYLDGNTLGAEDTEAPYSTSWNTTSTSNGTHTITARARDTVNQTTSAPITVNVQNTDPRAIVGEWSPLMNWPLVAVHATLLHTGEVLLWDGWENPITNAKVWNPTTNTFTNVPVDGGLFCAGTATAADGRVVVMGGHLPDGSGIKNISVFDPVSKTWTRQVNMNYSRWYPSVIQMPDNRFISFSGQTVQGSFANTPEIFDLNANTSTNVPISTPQLREIQYPQTSVLPSGKVLAISAEQGSVMTYDPSNNNWANLGTSQVPYGAWTSFAPGKYLITGGATSFNTYNPSNPAPSQKTSKVLDMTSGTPVWTDAGQMNQARSFHNVTMLPNGTALAIGGSETVNDYSTTGTVTAEQWDPATSTWEQMAAPARPRMYHSTSLLLPDGRILSAGGGRLAPSPDQLNAQFYSPPYLFQGPRPTITSAPSVIAHNSTMELVTPEASDIAKISFVNLGSVTHTADWNQRFLELPFTRNGDTLTVDTPANVNLAPENYYMVFAVNSNGVPSTAKIVKLGVPDTTAPTISSVQASNISEAGATVTWATNESADSRVEYGTTTAYGSQTPLDSTLKTSHSQNITGLLPNTLYHYRVKSKDASGNERISADHTFTTGQPDTQSPAVNLTSPAHGSTVSGSVAVSANASDNVGVAGVQFKLDGNNLGAEDVTAPYNVPWGTTQVSNGAHTITAVARDAAGNTTTAAGVTVTVSNSGGGGGLVAAYSFNEGSGSSVIDLSGNSNNGSIFQATWAGAGKFGSALNFDGSNDMVTVPDASSLDLTSGMTLEAWVRPTATSGWRTIMMKEIPGELAYAMYARESSNRPSGWIRVNPTGGSSQSVGATPGLPTNTWTHVATTYNGSTMKLYVNGALRASKSQTGPMYTSSGPLTFGGNAVWGEYFAGRLDEIRIYNRALDQTEIQTDMNLPL